MFRLDLDDAMGDSTRVKLPHPEIIAASEIGHVLLVDDGKVKLRVSGKGEGYLECTVEVEGKISNRKVTTSHDTNILFHFFCAIFNPRFLLLLLYHMYVRTQCYGCIL